jgi:hypothetical protein
VKGESLQLGGELCPSTFKRLYMKITKIQATTTLNKFNPEPQERNILKHIATIIRYM